jgi:hypothetical protein
LLCIRSWEEEKAALVAQVETLKKEARLYVPKAHGPESDDGEAGADETNVESRLMDLRRQLDESREKEVCFSCMSALLKQCLRAHCLYNPLLKQVFDPIISC